MQYHHDKRQAAQFAESALERIRSSDLPLVPEIFELWYVYFSGANAEVSRSIEILIANQQPITEERCRELHSRFLSETRNAAVVRRAGDQINATLRSVTGAVRDVRSAASEYGGRLGDVSRQIDTLSDPQAMRDVLRGMIHDTQAMIDRNQTLEAALDHSTTVMEELQRDLEIVRREAMTDGLTGLSNRKAFDQALRHIAEETKTNGTTFSLMMLDIDYFKNFNDNFGHQIGDQVLRLVARALTDGVKGRDIAARYGGEEFAVILPDTPLEAGLSVGNSLRKAVATKEVINRNSGEKLGRITMSVGVAQYKPGENIVDLIERADAALYTAKHNGRNQVAAAPTPTKD